VRLLPGNSSPRRQAGTTVRYGRVIVYLTAHLSVAAAEPSDVIDNDDDDRGTAISLRLRFHFSSLII